MIRAPFPWFGGKRRVADVVWRAFGADVPNYIEPFGGSLAVLLGRPGGAGKIETVNDADRWVANFWRAVHADPEAVAHWADWPVNEADLHARHTWLVNQTEFRERMHSDPDFYDVKVAGWWVWGICQWIGAGWCAEPNNRKRPKLDGIGKGVHSNAGHTEGQLPELAVPARACAVHRKLPNLAVKADGACAGRGILSDAAVSAHLPSLGNDRGIHGVAARGQAELADYLAGELSAGRAPRAFHWFLTLSERLRRVRVACGDWTRVLGNSVLGKGKNVGGRRPCAVFLDPPYADELRSPHIYGTDDGGVSGRVREWALEHGDDPELRIALCGYEGEHVMPATWTMHAWKAARGYASAENENSTRERVWFSPYCARPQEDGQRGLFVEDPC